MLVQICKKLKRFYERFFYEFFLDRSTKNGVLEGGVWQHMIALIAIL